MMVLIRGFCAALIALGLQGGVAAALDMNEVNEASLDMIGGDGPNPAVLRLQVLLDRAGASPGAIDGLMGVNTEKALTAFRRMQDLDGEGVDEDLWEALTTDDSEPILTEYTITEEDVSGPFLDQVPEDFAELAELDRIAYTGLEELLAEKFHLHPDLLRALNPDAGVSEAGSTIIVPDVIDRRPDGPVVVRIEVAKAEGKVRAFDEDDNLVRAYPATVGSAENPSPSGAHKVEAVAHDPVYYYRPDENFQQGDNTEPLDLPPGPNNPVGTVWIDLSEPSYGLHGTPDPELIARSESAGCVRLTNWDAEDLAELVEPGRTEVIFLEDDDA